MSTWETIKTFTRDVRRFIDGHDLANDAYVGWGRGDGRASGRAKAKRSLQAFSACELSAL